MTLRIIICYQNLCHRSLSNSAYNLFMVMLHPCFLFLMISPVGLQNDTITLYTDSVELFQNLFINCGIFQNQDSERGNVPQPRLCYSQTKRTNQQNPRIVLLIQTKDHAASVNCFEQLSPCRSLLKFNSICQIQYMASVS